MLVSIFLTAVVIASGAVVTYLYEDDAPLAARLCSGAVLGLTSFGLIGFAVAERLGLTPLSIAISTTIVALPLLLLIDQERYRRLNVDAQSGLRYLSDAFNRPSLSKTGTVLFFASFAVLMWLVFDRVMFVKKRRDIHR